MDLSQIDPTPRGDASYPTPAATAPRTSGPQSDKFSNVLNAKLRETSTDSAGDTQDDTQTARPAQDGDGKGAAGGPKQAAKSAGKPSDSDTKAADAADAAAPVTLPDPAVAMPIALPMPLLPLPNAAPSGLDFTLDTQLRSAGLVAALEAAPAAATPAAPVAQFDAALATATTDKPETAAALPQFPFASTIPQPSPSKPAVRATTSTQPLVTPQVPQPPANGPAMTLAAAPPAQAPIPAASPVIEKAGEQAVALTAATSAPGTAVKKAAVTTAAQPSAVTGDSEFTDSDAAVPQINVLVDRRPIARTAPTVANEDLPAQAAVQAATPDSSPVPKLAAATANANRPSDDAFEVAIKELRPEETKALPSKPSADAATNGASAAQMAAQPAAPAIDTTTATAAASRPLLHPVVEQVVMHLSKAAADSTNQIKIELRPIELGRIDVRMEIGPDGHVQAVFAADRPQTMELLQRDAGQLQRALQDAGLNVDSGSLSFDLRGNGNGSGGGNGFAGAFTPQAPAFDVPTELVAASQAYAAPGLGSGRVDIHV